VNVVLTVGACAQGSTLSPIYEALTVVLTALALIAIARQVDLLTPILGLLDSCLFLED